MNKLNKQSGLATVLVILVAVIIGLAIGGGSYYVKKLVTNQQLSRQYLILIKK